MQQGDEKMACRYVFTEEQMQELTNAAKANKRKDADRRLRALLMRAKGNKLAEIAQAIFEGIISKFSKSQA